MRKLLLYAGAALLLFYFVRIASPLFLVAVLAVLCFSKISLEIRTG